MSYDARTTVIAVLVSILLSGLVAWWSFGRETATEAYVERRLEERTATLARFVAANEGFQSAQVAINTRLTTLVETLAHDMKENRQRIRVMEQATAGARRTRESENEQREGQ